MSFFSTKVIDIPQDEKIKEGSLKKESRFRKVWRERWVVLTTSYLYTFESQGIYRNPTEEIDVKKIKTVKTDESKQGFIFVSFICVNNVYAGSLSINANASSVDWTLLTSGTTIRIFRNDITNEVPIIS